MVRQGGLSVAVLKVLDFLFFGLASSLWLILLSWITPKGAAGPAFAVVLFGLGYAAGYRPWWALAYPVLLAAWLLLAWAGVDVVWMFGLYNALTYVLGGLALGRGRWRLVSVAVFWLVFQLANALLLLALYPLAPLLVPTRAPIELDPYPRLESVPANAAVYALTYAVHSWAVARLSKQEPKTLWRPLLERLQKPP